MPRLTSTTLLRPESHHQPTSLLPLPQPHCLHPQLPRSPRESSAPQNPRTMVPTAPSSHRRAAKEARGAQQEGGGVGPQRAGVAACCPGGQSYSTEQLAPSAFFLPSSALLFPGHLHGDPTRISEDSIHHVLSLDVTLALLLNFLACLASFCVETNNGTGFGLSILWIILFTPCSFVCWYRPMYKAFRSDSSFNFFVFFFIFFAQDVLFVLQAIGIPGWGFSGWISALVVLRTNTAVAVIMLLVALLFTGIAVLGIVMLKRIHSLYRRTGASFQKAQQEFAAGVFSNPAVRTAAANAAAGAAENAFRAP
ncbi:secretory carrier-associated membrane protein 3 isoform X3 [Myotis lucifugus]|uniref:secretory carrier-associated membrane protein 3 isoform X3 n=1 Tax=Myotis lucifugus TaxID=59463 RepID=UPI000CCBFC38|nr:secretory carrier-associated membrane protein 3 isoform X3 [Myotis lucifugus]